MQTRKTTNSQGYHHLLQMVIACLLFALAACNQEIDESLPTPYRTILFYMGGDNSLSGEVSYKIDQIKTAALTEGCRVVIFKDVKRATPQLLELTMKNGTVQATVIREYNEMNSASATTLAMVLQEVRELCPSPSYGLVVFSHASGWMPAGTFQDPSSRTTPTLRSIITDGKSEMDMTDFASAIPDGMFDFIVLEACHTAGIEMAWELKDKTHYILGSSAEIVSPGFAPVYPRALALLYQEATDLKGFAALIETDFAGREGEYASLTLSVIDTQKLDALAAALEIVDFTYLVKTVNDRIAGKDSNGSRASIQLFDRNDNFLFFDLSDCYRSCMTAQQATLLEKALNEVVVSKAASKEFMPSYGGFKITSHCGLTMYIPQQEYPKLNEAYKQLRWYKEVLTH